MCVSCHRMFAFAEHVCPSVVLIVCVSSAHVVLHGPEGLLYEVYLAHARQVKGQGGEREGAEGGERLKPVNEKHLLHINVREDLHAVMPETRSLLPVTWFCNWVSLMK